MTDPLETSPVQEVVKGPLSLDDFFTRHPTSITREELMAQVEREWTNRAAWKRKQEKKGKEE